MNLEELRTYCLSKKGTSEGTPFGEGVLVYKVAGKMFALTSPDDVPLTVNLKCDPERAADLREQYEAVQPGYHMNKKHWNTITLDGSLGRALVRELIDHSYDVVVQGLKKSEREALLAEK